MSRITSSGSGGRQVRDLEVLQVGVGEDLHHIGLRQQPQRHGRPRRAPGHRAGMVKRETSPVDLLAALRVQVGAGSSAAGAPYTVIQGVAGPAA